MNENRPIAVVVGGGLNALGIVRSLAVGKVSTVLIAGGGDDEATPSRYPTIRRITDTAGVALLQELDEIGRSQRIKPVLFLTEEKSVVTVSEHRDSILPFYTIVLPQHETLMTLMRKEGFQFLAQSFGSQIPKAVHLKRDADLAELSCLRFPCVVKPAVKDYNYGAKFQKAYVAGSASEVASLFAMIEPVLPDLIAQEWIEGSDSDIYFCLVYLADNGDLISSFVGRKLRSWPPRVGGTASCVSAREHHDELTACTLAFFRQVGFVGMGSMEYKRDTRDGCFYMIEPTVGRTDFQEEVATVNGVNLPLAAYCHEANIPCPPCDYTIDPIIWREPIVDRWSAETQPEHLPPWGQKLADAYWRSDDPGPWIALTWRRLIGKIQAITGRLQFRK